MVERRVRISGEIDLANVDDLRAKLATVVDATADDVLLDCAAMTFIDSMSISLFAEMQQRLTDRGRRFRIGNLYGEPRRVIDLLDLSERLGIVENFADALLPFHASGEA